MAIAEGQEHRPVNCDRGQPRRGFAVSCCSSIAVRRATCDVPHQAVGRGLGLVNCHSVRQTRSVENATVVVNNRRMKP